MRSKRKNHYVFFRCFKFRYSEVVLLSLGVSSFIVTLGLFINNLLTGIKTRKKETKNEKGDCYLIAKKLLEKKKTLTIVMQ